MSIADRGYFNGEDSLSAAEAGITVTLPKPMTSDRKAEGRFGKHDFIYLPEEDYTLARPEKIAYRYTIEEKDWLGTDSGPMPASVARSSISCTTGEERRIDTLGARACSGGRATRLDEHSEEMRQPPRQSNIHSAR